MLEWLANRTGNWDVDLRHPYKHKVSDMYLMAFLAGRDRAGHLLTGSGKLHSLHSLHSALFKSLTDAFSPPGLASWPCPLASPLGLPSLASPPSPPRLLASPSSPSLVHPQFPLPWTWQIQSTARGASPSSGPPVPAQMPTLPRPE
jgi:hypothetical protein